MAVLLRGSREERRPSQERRTARLKAELQAVIGVRARFHALLAIVFVIARSTSAAETSPRQPATDLLTQAEQRQVEQYLALAIAEPRSQQAFAKLYSIYKKHHREYELLTIFRNAIEADRKNKNLHVLLAQVYIEFRDYHMAEARLRDAIKLDPQDYYPRSVLAEVLERKGEHGKATQQYQSAIALTSDVGDLVRSYEKLGRLHAMQNLKDEAVRAWDKALEYRKYDVAAHQRVAALCADFGLYQKAEQLYRQILDIAEKSPKTRCLTQVALGRLLETQDKTQPAIEAYRQALSFLDDDSHLRKEVDDAIFRCFEKSGNVEALVEHLQEVASEGPNDPNPLRRLAMVQGRLRRWADAAASLKAALALAPEDLSLQEHLLTTYREQNAYLEMASIYDKLIELNDENLAYLVGLGEAQLRLGLRDDALRTWERIAAEPDARRWELLGDTLSRHEFVEQAVDAYRKAAQADPSDVHHTLKLGKVLLTHGQRDEADGVFKTLFAEPTAGAPLHLEVAEAYDKADVPEATRQALEQGAERDASSYEIHKRLAEIYHNGKEYAKAAAAYSKAIDCASNLDDKLALNKHLINLYMNHMPRWPYEEDGKKAELAPLYALGEGYRQRMLRNPAELDVYMLFGQVNEAAYYNPLIRPFRLYRHRAKRTYEDVMDRNPLYLEAYFHKARRHLLDDEFEQAVLEYKKLLVINPVNKWKYYKEIGDLFATMGYMDQAFRFWQKVDVRSFSEPDLLYQLACRYFHADRVEDAIRIIKKAIHINPNNYKYHLTLGNLYDHQERYKEAIDEFRWTLALSTSDMLPAVRKRMSAVQVAHAKRLFAAGKFKEALAYFEEIREYQEVLRKHLNQMDQHYPDTLIQIARCSERLGDEGKAAAIYREALGKYAEHEAWISDRVTMAIPHLLSLKTRQTYVSRLQLPKPATTRKLSQSLRLVGQNRIVDSIQHCHIGKAGITLISLDKRWTVDVSDVSRAPAKRDTFHRYKRGIAVFDDLTCIVTKSEKPDRKGDQFDMLKAYAQDGRLKWQYYPPRHDVNIRQIVRTGNLLVLNCGRQGVMALDAATGKPAWPVPLAAGAGGCRGLHTDGKLVCIKHFKERKTSEMHFILAEVKTRNVLWRRPMGKDRLWLVPLVLGEAVVALDDFSHEMHVLSAKDGSLLYRCHFDSIFPRDPLTDGKLLYIHERNMEDRVINLHAIEPATAETRWTTVLKMPSIHRPPILLDGRFFYIDNYHKRILGIDPTDGSVCMDFDLLTCIPKYVFEETIICFEAWDGKVFLVTNGGHVYCFEIAASNPR